MIGKIRLNFGRILPIEFVVVLRGVRLAVL